MSSEFEDGDSSEDGDYPSEEWNGIEDSEGAEEPSEELVAGVEVNPKPATGKSVRVSTLSNHSILKSVCTSPFTERERRRFRSYDQAYETAQRSSQSVRTSIPATLEIIHKKQNVRTKYWSHC